jgi:hypothetical protein
VHHVDHPEYRLRFSRSPVVWPGGVVILPDLLLLSSTFGYEVSNDELLPDFLFVNLQLHMHRNIYHIQNPRDTTLLSLRSETPCTTDTPNRAHSIKDTLSQGIVHAFKLLRNNTQ